MIYIYVGSGIYHKPNSIFKSKYQEFHNINIGIFSVNETRMAEYFMGPGGRGAIGGGIREKNDRSGDFVRGEAAGSDSVQGVWGGYGSWVAGGTHAKISWEGIRGKKELVSHVPRRRTV